MPRRANGIIQDTVADRAVRTSGWAFERFGPRLRFTPRGQKQIQVSPRFAFVRASDASSPGSHLLLPCNEGASSVRWASLDQRNFLGQGPFL
jgi:hypothetical protein